MQKLFIILFFLPFLIRAQQANGVHFEKESTNWEAISRLARSQGKDIFVDCFATWCGPCKKMDSVVYSDDNVAQIANNKYISVKIQFDTSNRDDASIQKWYSQAHKFMLDYNITSFPTFLFFSAEGKITHRDVGYKDAKEFSKLLEFASDPNKQIYTLLDRYNKGEKEFATLPYLANAVRTLLKNRPLSNQIGQDYLQNFLYLLPEAQLYTKPNIDIIVSYVQTTTEKGFDMFFKHADKVDQVKRLGFSRNMVDYLITSNDINKTLYSDNGKPLPINPDWNVMGQTLITKYGVEYAQRNLINGQIRWYEQKSDWANAIAYNLAKIDKFGLDTTGLNLGRTNDMIWDVIFKHSEDKAILNRAIVWMKSMIDNNPGLSPLYDTYANLLYKVGRKSEAINYENIAIQLAEENFRKYKAPVDKTLIHNLTMMQNDQPTWTEN